jgi:hypothetical protein
MKARILVPVIGASLALIGPAAHAAGAHNALHCTVAKQAHTVAAQKPFFSPLNPRGLLTAQAKQCATAQKPGAQVHRPKQSVPHVKPDLGPFPTSPTPSAQFCLTYLDYPEYQLAPCSPAGSATVVAPAQNGLDTSGAAAQAAQGTSGEPPLADVEQAAPYYS